MNICLLIFNDFENCQKKLQKIFGSKNKKALSLQSVSHRKSEMTERNNRS
jgi:hypothetical protein